MKYASKLTVELFSDTVKCVSIGHMRDDIISSVIDKFPEFSQTLSSKTDILFWADRVKHIERHQKDFQFQEEYLYCFRNIPEIIRNPDFISIHPNKNSISFIRKFCSQVSVAIRISSDGKLTFRTIYPLRQTQLEKYIKNGHAWKIN